jgi:hypothetical protein
MRWIALITVAFVGACFWPTTPTGTTGGAGGGDAGANCPQTSCDNNGCVTCALNGPCASLWNACSANPSCVSLDNCWSSCAGGDTACQQGCAAQNPDAVSTYQAVNQCVYCDQCATICAGLCM